MAAPGEPIARDSGASAAALAFGVSPRLNPRKAARFEFGDDAAGHVFIETGARRGGLGASILAACAALAGLAHGCPPRAAPNRSEEHTSELQSLMRISYAVFCLKKKKQLRLILFYLHTTNTETILANYNIK